MDQLREKAAARFPRLVLPEATDPMVQAAARIMRRERLAHPILVGAREQILATGVNVTDIEIVDPGTAQRRDEYVQAHADRAHIAVADAARALRSPLDFAAMMVGAGHADGLVAGFLHGTPAVIAAGTQFVGLLDGVVTPSSFFIMRVPGWRGPEDEHFVFADCAVVENPTSLELADIAVTTAGSVKELLGWEPCIALLSFSTQSGVEHPDVDKVRMAVDLVRRRAPELCVAGEMQADVALVPAIAEKKMKNGNRAAGRANILVFPDLDAGNIAYMLVERFARASAYGPVLQGFKRPISGLSRGATLDDIVGAATVVAARA